MTETECLHFTKFICDCAVVANRPYNITLMWNGLFTVKIFIFGGFRKLKCCCLQGTVLNSWKVVWVVLADDGVEFYKKKTDNSPKGMIPLKGATLTSPCQDFTKRMVEESRL